MTRIVLALIFSCLLAVPAWAHHHRHTDAAIHVVAVHPDDFSRGYGHVDRGVAVAAQSMPHPAGCPSTAFCGCGASIEVFGHSIRDLWLASNWFRFPVAAPAPGMVAVRQHHVFVIRQVLGNGRVFAYDANSGGHMTRIHEVSLAGYSIRNPHRS